MANTSRQTSSEEILKNFFAETDFENLCSRERFITEFTGSHPQDTSSCLYDLIVQQHRAIVQQVQTDLPDKLQDDSKRYRDPETGLHSLKELIGKLAEALSTSETHNSMIQQHIDEHLKILEHSTQRIASFYSLGGDLEDLESKLDQKLSKCINLLDTAQGSTSLSN